jgi:membrane fusion protein (multidrug efflux system)
MTIRFVAACLVLVVAGCGAPPAPPAAPPPEVTVLTIVPEAVAASGTYAGRAVPSRTVEIRTRVTGTLIERPFTEGVPIGEGALLYRLDPREFEAARDSARARLAQTEAQVTRTATDLARTIPLAAEGAAAQADLDTVKAAALVAAADRDAAAAALAKADLDLSFCRISAPFAGIIGKSAVDPGALISPSTGVLATLDDVDPVAVEFTVSESERLAWRRDIQAGVVVAPAIDQLRVDAVLVDGSRHPHAGHISFGSARIQPETGTALLRAEFPNPDASLRPGQFVRLSISGSTRVGVVTVPQAAVLQSPAGGSVYVVGADGLAQVRPVRLGAWLGTRWVVEHGLTAGDRVVVDGIQRVRPGAPVRIAATAAVAR